MNKKVLITLAATFISFNSYADYYISGFGTVAGGKATGDEAVVERGGIAGYDEDSWSFDNGTFVGLQGTVELYDKLGMTVQAKFEASENWAGDVTWGYLSYDATDEWRIILGRQIMPHYIYSDFIDVSYTYNWIELPDQVYNAPFNSFNGVSSQYTFDFGHSSLFTQVLYGTEHDDATDNKYTDIWGGRLAYNYDWFTLNLAYYEFNEESSSSMDTPDGLIENNTDGVLISYDIGFQINYNNWYAIAEMTTVDLTDLREDGSTDGPGTLQPWMFSVAKRIGDFTPNVTYGESRQLDFNGEDSTAPFYTVGLRWDFYDSMALKTEYSHKEDSDGASGEVYQVAIVATF
ncbi:porin [Shewanella polaris]|uniref:Porin n=1 Tax=Shewanella polaris TaxID=2588449 RepID=A0A4Y5YE39_9GAMM|nr:porin [Shewanella polaris]QDE30786.1 porin [Shewanella polaris]